MYDPISDSDLFICHASKDAQVANAIVARLEAMGLVCWLAPRDVLPGNAYADSIYYAIERAPVFIVLMSKAANSSRHVARELELADQMNKRVVPIRLEEFGATGAFCYYTRAAHFYRWYEAPDEVLRRVSEQVTRARESQGKSLPTQDPKEPPGDAATREEEPKFVRDARKQLPWATIATFVLVGLSVVSWVYGSRVICGVLGFCGLVAAFAWLTWWQEVESWDRSFGKNSEVSAEQLRNNGK